ncbi:hypothetical protein CEXT_211251 [Caerostris extrusa]|uniref:Uncharacterized protein n=1 Tax=Caerostris extrusa TaxID=172846 RepID=A0AAV4NDF1_CAEEX|nr:hypothetical protein CEXT_211251 [Caerostris extrusa]
MTTVTSQLLDSLKFVLKQLHRKCSVIATWRAVIFIDMASGKRIPSTLMGESPVLINQTVEIFVTSPVGELLATCGNPGSALLAGGKQTIRMSRCEAVARGCRTRLAADLMMETPPPSNTTGTHSAFFIHSGDLIEVRPCFQTSFSRNSCPGA